MRHTLRLLCCAVLTAAVLCGCGQNGDGNPAPSGSSETAASVQTDGVPADAAEQLRAVLEQEPAAVPADGWTDDTLLDVTYVNGKKLQIPFSMDALGDGYQVVTDEDNFIQREEKTTAALSYYGMICGLLTTPGKVTPESFAEQQFSGITFYTMVTEPESYPEVFPISINGVTICTSYDEMVARLGFTAVGDEDPNTTGRSHTVTGLTEHYYVRIIVTDAVVRHITIAQRDSE